MIVWRKIFMVVESQDGFEIITKKGHPVDGTSNWAIDTTGPGSGRRSKQIMPAAYIHEKRAAAEETIRKLRKKKRS